MRSVFPKFPSLVLRFKSHALNPNPNFSLNCPLLFSVNLSTPRHLRQCLAHAFAAGLLGDTHLHLWNSLLHSLSRSPNLDVSVPLFHLLRAAGLPVDDYTFTAVLKALASLALLREGENIHSLTLKLGFERHTFVLNSLIHMYFACGFNASAKLVFDSAEDSTRDVVSWNSLISGYFQSGMCYEGLMVFRSMVSKSIAMDAVTPVSALIGCGKIRAIGLGRKIHNLVIVYGFDLNFYLGSSLVNMYARCGYVEDARKLFDRIPEKNVVCWTSIISGYVQSGQFRESIELFKKMQIEGVRADDPTLASILSSCAELGALAQGKYIHKYCDVNNTGKLLSVKNALIDMYSKCGDIQRALQVFQGIVQRDVISWTVMISGLAINGYSQEALYLFSRMELSEGIMPNEITFIGVLTACNHGGLVEKGYHYFKQMVDHYGLIPQIEHYGCMVDLLGRANLLEKAYEFIMKMPIRPDVVIWRSLLFACRANGNVGMAEYAAERILELEPGKCGVHVLLSNVYAVSSRWSDVKRVRGAMWDWDIQKLPGFSSIELDGVVHEFLATDRSHRDSGIIYELLWMVNRHILSETYNGSCYLI